ncbi:MAG TPA: hypothetical protein VMR77_00635 [Patescibacteria group bacterium]|nr:hypothetical protein [Patescibacteria group bacterium]
MSIKFIFVGKKESSQTQNALQTESSSQASSPLDRRERLLKWTRRQSSRS